MLPDVVKIYLFRQYSKADDALLLLLRLFRHEAQYASVVTAWCHNPAIPQRERDQGSETC